MYRLRELERKDLPRITNWRNDPELIASLGAPLRYINPEVDVKWYESYMANRNNTVRCAIVEENGNDEILGLVSLTSIDWTNRSCELHIMIGEPVNQGKGIGTYAVRQMCAHAFENMNLRRVELSVLEDNKRAQHLYEKLGFIKEGVKRKAKFKQGSYCDMLLYALLREEYSAE